MTQKDEVIALHAEIYLTIPTIAVVAQGAIVLEDTAVQDMTLEQFLKVSKPKVEGSVHLNNLFQNETLDFFVFFSSATSVVGFHGQANYAAANTFMTSVPFSELDAFPEPQRVRSLVTDLSSTTGGFFRSSERDFYQLFGEAVLADLPGSTAHSELVSGIQKVDKREEQQPVWESWPRLSHFILDHQGGNSPGTKDTQAGIPIKLRLSRASNDDQVWNIIWDAFIRQLSLQFQIKVETARDEMYDGLENSRLPYPMLVEKLDLQRNAKYFRFFQVYADYRMGQREIIPWGEDNKLHIMGFDPNVPYDVYLDTIDEPDGECVHHFFLRKDLFDASGAERLAKSYGAMIQAFVAEPRISVGDVDLSKIV